MNAIVKVVNINMNPTTDEEERLLYNSRDCICCREKAVSNIKIGNENYGMSQTTSIPLCEIHAKELKVKLDSFFKNKK